MDVFEGRVLFDEPGVKAVEFSQRAHALAHFLRATSGSGALMALLGSRAPQIRHLRRWFRPIVQALGTEHLLIGGWFAASSPSALRRTRGGTDLPASGGAQADPASRSLTPDPPPLTPEP
jgi:hypothetical protein